MNKKIKVLTISDHPLSPSGVGTQTKYVCQALLESGKFCIRSLGGAIKHDKYDPIKTDEYGDDWVIFPVDGYGNAELVRSMIRHEKPDILWFMTDPRFWGWLWMAEHEIRPLMPMVYYHVWDNYPPPEYNKQWYVSNDVICTISKVTDDIVKAVAPDIERHYLPHAVDSDVFKTLKEEEIKKIKLDSLGADSMDKMVFFWNNRNARRKQSGTLIFWFKEFLDEVGHDKACLIMHTDPKDPNGQDLEAIIHKLGLDEGQVLLSTAKYPSEHLAAIYNMADCTINISDAEGFGLATLESLSCGTPIIVNMTGGLQEQVTDGEEWFGIGIEPCSKAIIGSQDIPYIREDRLNKEQFVNALIEFYNMTPEERNEMGQKGQEHVKANYGFENFKQQWVARMLDINEKYGSWEDRKNYKSWNLVEI
jgi:glycosyltransferase involved in cell wall biosynthesis